MADTITFTVLLGAFISCHDGSPMNSTSTCEDGLPLRRVELSLLTGKGECDPYQQLHSCAESVTDLLLVRIDDKVVVRVPADVLAKDDIQHLIEVFWPLARSEK